MKTQSKDTKRRIQVPLRLLPEDYKKIQDLAKKDNYSINAVLEEAILQFVGERHGD